MRARQTDTDTTNDFARVEQFAQLELGAFRISNQFELILSERTNLFIVTT